MSTEEFHVSKRFFTVAEAIELCLDPHYADNKFLQNVLLLFAKRLQLDSAILVLSDLTNRDILDVVPVEQRKDGTIFLNLLNKNKIVDELEGKITKITRILEKMTMQQEYILKKFDEKSAITLPLRLEKDQSAMVEVENSSVVAGGGGGISAPGDYIRTENLDNNKFDKEFTKIRMEFNENLSLLTKNVEKISAEFQEHKESICTMKKVCKILDCVAPKDYVDSINEKVEKLIVQNCKIQKDITRINSRIEDILECSRYMDKRIKDIQEKMKIIGKIREIFERLEQFEVFKKKILDEFDKFHEIIEYLKITKASKEELDYIFDEKADRDDLLKLVTLEFFKSVQDDLAGGIVQILEQLMRDEIEWERAYKEIQIMLDAKADEGEVTALKKYIDCKLQIIQKKIDDIIKSRLTAHAAAIKIRLLKDARCIVCTAEAQMNDAKYPVPLMKGFRQREYKCICEPSNRYCGGSHTVLGSDQKLIRKFCKAPMKPPISATLNYSMSIGKDGKFYRSRKERCICDSPTKSREQLEVNEEETKKSDKICRCTE